MNPIFYVGWIGFGNIGDDLMWRLFRDTSRSLAHLQSRSIVPSMPGIDLTAVDEYDAVVLGGGSLLIPGYVDVLYHALKQGKRIAIWGSGSDWISKADMNALLNESGSPLEAAFSAAYKKKLRLLFEHAVFAGVRGPLTKRLLVELGVNPATIETAGDPGLLLTADHLDPPSDSEMWTDGEQVIGINWGTSYDRIYGEREQAVEDELAKAALQWVLKGYQIYIYTVWEPDRPSCLRLFEKIGIPEHVRVVPRTYREHDLMRIIRRCAFTVNFKLHANVMSAAAEVPYLALGYRFKTFDFAASLEHSQYVLSTDSPDLSGQLIKRKNAIDRQRNSYLHQLKGNLAMYREPLQRPFHDGW
ncbi:polysaccharide pyruvyl transferase family protein [Paenibacillus humicola]|uniref:polysaccharide pyruvyl transferase family protein n=1 Tax=Paenibacillus humicola TaxID=3110540 RepID=UPI00237B7366|nr:polysaccharide pyruvyl transferase family protein [Paenibacillus humicola]